MTDIFLVLLVLFIGLAIIRQVFRWAGCLVKGLFLILLLLLLLAVLA